MSWFVCCWLCLPLATFYVLSQMFSTLPIKQSPRSNRGSSAFPPSVVKMNLWLLLSVAVLAECRYSCPDLCSCSLRPSEVICSRSSLTHFPVEGLSNITVRLSIQSTGLAHVTARHLSVVPLLNELQLYHNNLTSLPSDLLKGVPLLNTLDLTGNQLDHLPPDVFSHASLHNLVLKNNRIEKVDAEWFSPNSSLISLDLSGNRLTGVPSALLRKLPHLQSLDLSDNNLQELQADALKNLHQLEMLNLAGNVLTSLRPATFTHNLKLSKLFLQENHLRDLPATLLRGLRHLELLLLNQNQLQCLPSGFLDEGGSSFRVILAGNPWVCDEKIESLKKWLTVHPQNVVFLEEVTCAGPEALKHRQVASLTDSELLSSKI
ncbi:leucine-rich alpha-2-glycoprotein [Pleuronectes platessa]|uniref:leucine-rich alpha-2-glycoprotein n=1 Tax=Pleuronectes platessa TaxID=8262 RepID=UPI00232A2657|nr:leucine-rich alpha-2-glycoprotein [Pleuronectes platessa]